MSVKEGKRVDPYKSYKFVLKLDGTDILGVSKVSSLKKTTEVIAYRYGASADRDRKTNGRVTYDAITMERGVTHDHEFERWAMMVHPDQDGDIDLENYKLDLELVVRNERGIDVIRYLLKDCWVSEWNALPELDASANAIAIESVKLEVGYWYRDLALEPGE